MFEVNQSTQRVREGRALFPAVSLAEIERGGGKKEACDGKIALWECPRAI